LDIGLTPSSAAIATRGAIVTAARSARLAIRRSRVGAPFAAPRVAGAFPHLGETM